MEKKGLITGPEGSGDHRKRKCPHLAVRALKHRGIGWPVLWGYFARSPGRCLRATPNPCSLSSPYSGGLLRGPDSNRRPAGYEPTELPSAPPHDAKVWIHLKATRPPEGGPAWYPVSKPCVCDQTRNRAPWAPKVVVGRIRAAAVGFRLLAVVGRTGYNMVLGHIRRTLYPTEVRRSDLVNLYHPLAVVLVRVACHINPRPVLAASP